MEPQDRGQGSGHILREGHRGVKTGQGGFGVERPVGVQVGWGAGGEEREGGRRCVLEALESPSESWAALNRGVTSRAGP